MGVGVGCFEGDFQIKLWTRARPWRLRTTPRPLRTWTRPSKASSTRSAAVKQVASDVLVEGCLENVPYVTVSQQVCCSIALAVDQAESIQKVSDMMSAQSRGCNATSSVGGDRVGMQQGAGMDHVMPWFHGAITREEAEQLLTPSRSTSTPSPAPSDGLFLVRDSTNFVGDFTLCVSFQCKVEHYRIIAEHKHNGDRGTSNKKRYTIDEDEFFEDLISLVRHYREDADGLCTRLTEAVPKEDKALLEKETKMLRDRGWVIEDASIQFTEKIGKGEFGNVVLGTMLSGRHAGQKVAVKVLKDLNQRRMQFLSEASVMTNLQHENLVCLRGVVLEAEAFKIVTEYMSKGSLLEYLRSRGRQYVTRTYQIKFALDACRGMAYLESKGIIHRDLAARNILISEKDVAKVSDFGLAIRDQSTDSGSDTELIESGKLPIKWTAPEALKRQLFTSKSDVWSFGVLLWEIYSFGRVPYPRIPIADVVKYVESNQKMDPPEGCPDNMYHIMLNVRQNMCTAFVTVTMITVLIHNRYNGGQ